MRHTTTRFLAVAAIAGAAVLGLSACTAGSDSSSSDSGSSSSSTLPPIIVPIADVDGTTVEVPVDNVIDLVTADDDDVTAWKATIADDAVAEFVPGTDDGSATFNPGIKPRAEGTTEVVLSNSTTDEKVSFTVTVTAAAQ